MAGAPDSNWTTWATGVLNGIGAPVNGTNIDTLWKWTLKENTSARNNYLATTQNAPGATAFNTFGNDRHVWNYPTVAVGVGATVQTLQNGLYGNVLTMLKNTVPANQWTAAAKTDLNKWGGSATYSNFLGGATPPRDATPVSSADIGATNPLDVLGGLSGAVGSIGATFQKSLYYVAGTVLLLAGVGLLAVLLVKGSAAPAARLAANFTPAGRALNAVSPPKPNQTPKGARAEVAANRRAFRAGQRVRTTGGVTNRERARDRVAVIQRNRERNGSPSATIRPTYDGEPPF